MSTDTAVVLAAGEGTRLRPLTKYRPKPMLPAANRPILERVLDAVVEAGFSELHVVVGYRRDRVQNHVGPSFRGVPVHYHVQEKRLGTGHALLQAADAVEGEFLLVNGDEVLAPATVASIVETHDPRTPATMAIVESDDAPEYGAVRRSGDRVVEFEEKPGTGEYRYLNVGAYAFDDRIFEAVEATERRDGELSLADTLSRLTDSEDGALRCVEAEGPWVRADYPWDLLSVAKHLLAEGGVDEPAREEGVHVAERATVHPAATLEPPVVVSADCEVGPGAVVGPYTALGPNVTVAANATVGDSLLDADTRVGEGATLVDCVTGEGVAVGPGAVVPGGPAEVRVGDRVFADRSLGGLLADRATLGGAATLAPGTLVGPEATIAAGARADGVVGEDETVR